MWDWTEEERLKKFMKSVQKWLEFQSTEGLEISEEVVDKAFHKGKNHSYEIIQSFDIKEESNAGYLQTWVEIGLFAGYLTGWKQSEKLLNSEHINVVNKDFYITKTINETAKQYSIEVSNNIFEKLLRPPVSPLIDGLDKKILELLKITLESSLYAGFLSGVEDAFVEKTDRFNPFDLKRVMS